jgi:hypothetical protein
MAPLLLLHHCAPPSLLLPHRPPRLLKHRLPVHRGLAMPTPAPQLPYPARTVIRQCRDSDQDREGRMRNEYPDKEGTCYLFHPQATDTHTHTHTHTHTQCMCRYASTSMYEIRTYTYIRTHTPAFIRILHTHTIYTSVHMHVCRYA